VRMDLTRTQLNQERARWTVRLADGGELGRIAAEIVDGRVRRLRLGAPPR
jgi:hypothetical protein